MFESHEPWRANGQYSCLLVRLFVIHSLAIQNTACAIHEPIMRHGYALLRRFRRPDRQPANVPTAVMIRLFEIYHAIGVNCIDKTSINFIYPPLLFSFFFSAVPRYYRSTFARVIQAVRCGR